MKRVWIGRSPRRATAWAEAARAAGWEAEALPLIRTAPCATEAPAVGGEASSQRADAAGWLRAARPGDLVVLTSSAAVEYGLVGVCSEGLSALRYAVVGSATRATLREAVPGARIVADADGQGSARLAEQVLVAWRAGAAPSAAEGEPDTKSAPDPTIWWPCAAEPRPEMERAFGAAGVPLAKLPCYRTELCDGPLPPTGEPILVFSPSGLASLALRLSSARESASAADRARGWPPLIAVGATTAAAARERGQEPCAVLGRLVPEGLSDVLAELSLPVPPGGRR